MTAIYQHDYVELLIGLVTIVIGIIQFFRNRQKLNSYSGASLFLFSGVALLLFSTTGNSLAARDWEKNYIISFLSLKEVGGWFFRGLAFFGYILFSWGIAIFLIVKTKRAKRGSRM